MMESDIDRSESDELAVKLKHLKRIREFIRSANATVRILISCERRIHNFQCKDFDREKALDEVEHLRRRFVVSCQMLRRSGRYAIKATAWLDESDVEVIRFLDASRDAVRNPRDLLLSWLQVFPYLNYLETLARHAEPRKGRPKKISRPKKPATVGKAVRYLSQSLASNDEISNSCRLTAAGYRNIRKTVSQIHELVGAIDELKKERDSGEIGAVECQHLVKRLAANIAPRTYTGWQVEMPFFSPVDWSPTQFGEQLRLTNVPASVLLDNKHQDWSALKCDVALAWRAYQSISEACEKTHSLTDKLVDCVAGSDFADVLEWWAIATRRLNDVKLRFANRKFQMELTGQWMPRDFSAMKVFGQYCEDARIVSSTKARPAPESPSDGNKFRPWVVKAAKTAAPKLPRKARLVVSLLAEKGQPVPLVDLAIERGIDWEPNLDALRNGWTAVQKANKVLREKGIELARVENAAVLRPINASKKRK